MLNVEAHRRESPDINDYMSTSHPTYSDRPQMDDERGTTFPQYELYVVLVNDMHYE